MAVVEDVDAVLVQQRLHGLPHLVVLLEGGVGGVPGVVRVADHPARRCRRVVASCGQSSKAAKPTVFCNGHG